ncbi:MAG: hypothetical protein COX57_09475, partial [Alphaproteobacteria bacterium CG_4_10_14_0_2_um_filter_63_37]
PSGFIGSRSGTAPTKKQTVVASEEFVGGVPDAERWAKWALGVHRFAVGDRSYKKQTVVASEEFVGGVPDAERRAKWALGVHRFAVRDRSYKKTNGRCL